MKWVPPFILVVVGFTASGIESHWAGVGLVAFACSYLGGLWLGEL